MFSLLPDRPAGLGHNHTESSRVETAARPRPPHSLIPLFHERSDRRSNNPSDDFLLSSRLLSSYSYSYSNSYSTIQQFQSLTEILFYFEKIRKTRKTTKTRKTREESRSFKCRAGLIRPHSKRFTQTHRHTGTYCRLSGWERVEARRRRRRRSRRRRGDNL